MPRVGNWATTTNSLRVYIQTVDTGRLMFWPGAVIDRITQRPNLPTRLIVSEYLGMSNHLWEQRNASIDIFIRSGMVMDPGDPRQGDEFFTALACHTIKLWTPHPIGDQRIDVIVSLRALLECPTSWFTVKFGHGG